MAHTGVAWMLKRGIHRCVHARLLEKCSGITRDEKQQT